MSGQSWGGCLEARPNGYEELDTAPTSGTPDTLWVPFFVPDEPDAANYPGYSHTYLTDGVNSTQDPRLKRYQKYAAQNNNGPNTGCDMLKVQPLRSPVHLPALGLATIARCSSISAPRSRIPLPTIFRARVGAATVGP